MRLQKQAVYREMAEVCEKWGLVEMDKFTSSRREASTSSMDPSSAQSNADSRASMTSSPMPSETQHDNLILTLMNTTTSAIRAAQKYFLALPPEKLPYGPSSYMDQQQKRDTAPSSSARGLPFTLGVVTASRPIPRHSTVGVASSSKIIDRSNNITDEAGDPLLRLRKASLATLGTLKEMEARFRLPHDEVPIDQLDESMQELSVSSSTSSSAPQPTFQVEDTSASERSGSSDASRGHLYRDDVSLLDLAKEGQIVKNWIETVDSLLSDLESGSKTPRPRTKSGNLESGIGSLPIWARDDRFEHDSLGE